jgi:hypothetical protein
MTTVVRTAATARALEYLSVLMLRREHRPMQSTVEHTLRRRRRRDAGADIEQGGDALTAV